MDSSIDRRPPVDRHGNPSSSPQTASAAQIAGDGIASSALISLLPIQDPALLLQGFADHPPPASGGALGVAGRDPGQPGFPSPLMPLDAETSQAVWKTNSSTTAFALCLTAVPAEPAAAQLRRDGVIGPALSDAALSHHGSPSQSQLAVASASPSLEGGELPSDTISGLDGMNRAGAEMLLLADGAQSAPFQDPSSNEAGKHTKENTPAGDSTEPDDQRKSDQRGLGPGAGEASTFVSIVDSSGTVGPRFSGSATSEAANQSPASTAGLATEQIQLLRQEASQRTPVANLVVELDAATATPVRLRLSNSNGPIRLEVHSPEPALRGLLRTDLEQLVSRLETAGYQTSSVESTATAPHAVHEQPFIPPPGLALSHELASDGQPGQGIHQQPGDSREPGRGASRDRRRTPNGPSFRR